MSISLQRCLNGNIEIKSRVNLSSLSLTIADHPTYSEDFMFKTLSDGRYVLVYQDLQDVWVFPKDHIELLNRRGWVFGTRVPHKFHSYVSVVNKLEDDLYGK